jgi:hypothetical protein
MFFETCGCNHSVQIVSDFRIMIQLELFQSELIDFESRTQIFIFKSLFG